MRYPIKTLGAILAVALTLIWPGCEGRKVDIDENFQTEPRENRAPAPPTGLKQNPGRPKSYRLAGTEE